ncbi:NADH-ubiquinone reductase complex 1 MLRQ subunit [Kalmanozyma brasiliensis GHG001]|uniref:NADH-ubiquinone reductase complex 1 MLRQ subunit n=1 Tax=Kalmanozyma brasiliensis (strain GHG001) TaxID=1365824 RepID=UPI002867FE8F|nr:NADH-ubiquinone reductase complex 1 MLRQ subunit [Kalmanozyma brasiliensis GHG001]EST08451.2 NADH-ubiquinone reductase complex 1 MLRQ subunit [Kalmanozyma brasiliensis GHG001]
MLATPRLPPRIQPSRCFTTSSIRKDDQSRAKAGGLKEVFNRPEITPLFLFTGAIISLAVFFLGKHLVKDKELQLDHHQAQRFKTKTEDLDFDEMAKVADDPDGKLTKEAIEEDKKRKQRLEGIREEKQEKAKSKV